VNDTGAHRIVRRAPMRDARIVGLAFLVFGLFWLGSEGSHHGDERFYTDAALRMLASGDWWRPEYADGTARVNKPLLVYWLIAGSMEVFGPGLFAARLPFLVAGALVLPLTARLARALLPGSPHAPLLAAVLVASNGSLPALAFRSTPDILLVTSVTIAWVGLAELLVTRRPPQACAWWLWAGIGLAAASKGGLAVFLLLFACIAVTTVDRRAWRGLLHPPALAAGIAVAAVSLAPLWWVESTRVGVSFIEDQVGSRLVSSPLDMLETAGEYLGSTARHFLPYSLAPLFLIGARRQRQNIEGRVGPGSPMGVRLALVFAATLWVVFSVGNLHRGRYLAPAYPLLACALSVAVLAAAPRPVFGWMLRIGTYGLTAASILLVAVTARADALAGASVAAAAAVGLLASRGGRPRTRPLRFGLTMAAFVTLAVPAVRATYASDHLTRAAQLPELDSTWGFSSSTPSLVRVLSGGRLDPTAWPDTPQPHAPVGATSVLVAGERAERLRELGWRLEPCGFLARRLDLRDLWPLLRARDPRAWFRGESAPVFVAQFDG
jgi:4-amino-4-deoxy-L-arabinose transferase-like glycosyltransferase